MLVCKRNSEMECVAEMLLAGSSIIPQFVKAALLSYFQPLCYKGKHVPTWFSPQSYLTATLNVIFFFSSSVL